MRRAGVRARMRLLFVAVVIAGLSLAACGEEGKPEALEPLLTDTGTPSPTLQPTRGFASPTPQPTPETLPPAPQGSLLFLASRNYEVDIYSVGADGKGLVKLTPDAPLSFLGGWSPDGTRIAFTSHEELAGEVYVNHDIYVMDRDGKNATNVTNTPDIDEAFASWSPDGSRLLFIIGRGETAMEFWLMDADGAKPRQLVPWCDQCSLLDWSPDGTQLAGYLTLDDQPGVYVVNAGDGSRQQIPGPPERWTTPSPPHHRGQRIRPADARAVTWSPDGTSIAYVQHYYGVRDAELILVRPDGTDTRLLYEGEDVGAVTWSPDGKRLAFSTQAGELSTIGVDGMDLRTIAAGESLYYLQWSPDGKHIAYVSRQQGNAEVYVLPAQGGKPRNVSNSPWNDTKPLWSPDSQELVFSSDRNTPDGIYWMWPDGSQQTRMTTGPVEPRAGGALPYVYPGLLTSCPEAPDQLSGAACLSPDGQATALVAFRGDESKDWELILIDTATRQERILTPDEVKPEPSPPVWAPDGSRLAFLGQQGESTWLYLLDVGSGLAQRLTEADALANTSVTIQWSPDGAYIYYTKGGYCVQGCLQGFLYRIRADGADEERLTELRVLTLLGFSP